MNYKIFMVLLCAPLLTYAQKPVSLEDAIGMARNQSPRLKIAESNIRQAQASKGESWEIAPTSANFSWGQINSDDKHDKQVAVEQNFGSLLTPYYKNALVKNRVRTGEYYRQLVEREVTAEVKRAWAYYQYAYNVCALYRDQEQMASDLQRIGDLRYKQGEITLLEEKMMSTLAADMHNKLFQAREDLRMAAQRFQWVCYSTEAIVPSDTTLAVFPVATEQAGSIASESYSNYYNSLAAEKRAQVGVEKSHFFPELTAGYNWQNILPLKNLNSWMVGVAIPIFYGSQKSKVRQAQIAATTAQMEAADQMRLLNIHVSELRASLARYNASLAFYNSSALNEADQLMKAANLQLKASETGVAEYIQSVGSAREIRKGYIDAVYQYNVAALEYEMYKQ
jgi:cobalt-zinc-cadmium resistance protein CzcA